MQGEAPLLTPKQQKKSISSKSKRTVLKQSLLNPYKLVWPSPEPDDHDAILGTISKVLKEIMDVIGEDIKTKRKRPWVKTATVIEDTPEVRKHKNIRSQLVCGLNEVIKKLERDNLRCFVVCRSAVSLLPTKPLLLLSATRNCPGVCLNDFSQEIGKLFSIGSLMAFGIKKPSKEDVQVPELDEIVQVITDRSSRITLPWLPEPEKMEEAKETCGTESEEMETRITFEYQPANIGQIQPNPNRKRKKKNKGNKM
ncbi:uncharacterized protein LOC135495048 [Lineus longissimus]|uniref:uncharacterized protein LOC135495048 n=1 Tax=Lineus longissimus TaxID=88925 RepID=UPI002B4C6CD0